MCLADIATLYRLKVAASSSENEFAEYDKNINPDYEHNVDKGK